MVPGELVTVTSNQVLRKLERNDIPAAMRLSTEAGWNQTEDDWRLLVELAPDGCFAVEVDGELASTTTLFTYGTKLGWIGMVLTRTDFRGRGLARLLLTHALSIADSRGVESVKLDATEQGRPLYEKLGFHNEQIVERWERPAEVQESRQQNVADARFPEPFALDAEAFGADRSALLTFLAKHHPPVVIGNSFLLTRPGRLNKYLGPCVAESSHIARDLIESVIHEPISGGWFWDLLSENKHAASLARELGFVPMRRLVRMARGKELRADEEAIYALAAFELG